MSRASWSLLVLLSAALVLSVVAVPDAAAQLRTYGVSLTVDDAGPEAGPFTTELDPVTVPVELEVTCEGPEVPAGELEFSVAGVVEDAGSSPAEEFSVRVDPATQRIFFDEQSCVTGEEVANATIQVTVTPGHLSMYGSPVRVLVWAESTDPAINESATFHVRPGLSGQVSLQFPATTFETDVRAAYNVTYKVLNDMNTDVEVTWGAVTEDLRHEVAPMPFVACNTHETGCTNDGLTGSFEVVPPEGAARVEETVTLAYTVRPAGGGEEVLDEDEVTLTLVYAPGGDGAGSDDDEESPALGPLALVVVALVALLRGRRPGERA